MKLLELFSGTKSVSKAVGHLFEEVVSVDIEKKYEPTILTDILLWDYRVYPPGYFHSIWASPPCTEYSCLNNARPEKTPNLELADSIVKRTIEIIEYFNPEQFFIENPDTGTLKDRDFMLGIPFVILDYCQFSDWGYRKRTRFWTCNELEDVLCHPGCVYIQNGRHVKAVGNSTYEEYWTVPGKRLEQRYAIPAGVIRYLFRDFS